MVHLEEEVKVETTIPPKNIIEVLLENTIKYLGITYECDLEVLIVDEMAMKNINSLTRNINKPTDVLSYPYEECISPGKLNEESKLDFHPETGELLLGQIVVCSDICKKQSIEYNHSIDREFAFLITHSLLHLFGYDHMEESMEKEMIRDQEEILKGAGFTRD